MWRTGSEPPDDQTGSVIPARHAANAKAAESTHTALQPSEPAPATVAVLLPPDQLAALIEAGIEADDSEQRSLAILELAQAPIEQSLGALDRILRENRDRRSRITALHSLMRLQDSPLVRERRQLLLDLLSRDSDAGFAEVARAASAGST